MLSETRQALEKAADLLMDHGVIRTGAELEAVCEQIRNLKLPRLCQRVSISNLAIMQSNAPRDMVIGLLRAEGIPAVPNPGVGPFNLDMSIRVDRGWIHYRHDYAQDTHIFEWDSDGVPF